MNARVLHVASGARRGADLPLPASSRCVIGSAPAQCDVVLADAGVAPCHCVLSADGAGRVVCTALDAPVWIGQRELAPGASLVLPDFLPLRCGRSTLLLGPPQSDWSFALRAAASAPGFVQRADDAMGGGRGARPGAFMALVLGSALLVAGTLWATARWIGGPAVAEPAQEDLARTQRWLASVAPAGSELDVIVDESRKRLVVAGYVRSDGERRALEAAVARRSRLIDAELVSVESLTDAVAQAAQAHGLDCQAEYQGAGRVACANAVAGTAAAQQLRDTASARIAGLNELVLSVVEVPAQAAAGPRGRYAVLMSNRRGSALIGPDGTHWRVGDSFNGMRILRIGLDEVTFERDRREHVVALALLGR